MKNPDAILTADWHIRADTPRCRTDDFQAAIWKKVEFIRNLAFKYDIPILLAGDLGLHSQWPNWLIEKFMAYTGFTEIISIPGQHDLPEHNLKLYKKSAIGVLNESKFIKLIGILDHDNESSLVHFPFKINKNLDLFLFPFPYGTRVKDLKLEDYQWPKKDIKIALTHQMVIKDKPEWPGQVADSAISLLKKFPNYKLILSGDNHKPFVVKYNRRILVNPGSMMRTTADQINHRPRVYLWRAADNKVEAVYLPIEKGVIDRSHIDNKKQRDERIGTYVSRLSEQYEIGLSFTKNMENHFNANRIRKPVKERIWEACER